MRLMNISTADESEPETGEISKVKDIKAYDENGNKIPVTFDDETGEVDFSQEPAEIKYNYITDFNDVEMDVSADTEADDGIEAECSGGGCNSVRNEELGSRKYLVLALFLLGLMEFALLKKSGAKKM